VPGLWCRLPKDLLRGARAVSLLMAYPWAEMAFCCHCGKPAEGGLFCAACGKPIPPDAVEAMTAEFHRYHKEMRLTVVALGLVIVVTAGLIVNGVMHEKRAAGRSLFGGEASSPTLRQQQPAPTQPTTTQTPPGQAVTPGPFTSQPQQPVPEVIAPGKSNPASRPPTGGIDPQAVQNALTSRETHPCNNGPRYLSIRSGPTAIPAHSRSRLRTQTSPISASPLPVRSIPLPTPPQRSLATTGNATPTPK
jgi:hypothetical protein